MLAYIAETQDTVKIVMVKDERQKEALHTLKTMKKRTNARNKQVRRVIKDMNKTLANNNVDATDVDAIWDAFFAEIDQYDSDMLDLRFELREHVNRQEWAEIFSPD